MEALRQRLRGEFQASLDMLEVVLSLDKRFVRTSEGLWLLDPGRAPDTDTQALVDQALGSRQRAIEALLDDRQAVQERAAAIEQQLAQGDEKLARLGHRPAPTVTAHRRQGEGYSLEFHVRRLSPETRQLLVQIHQAIVVLPATSPAFNKYHIAYSVRRRFALIIPHQHNVDVLMKTGADFEDPNGWTRDATGRRLGMERSFRLDSVDGIPYAMRLIEQAHHGIGG
jgi:predicted transport protein